MTAMTYETIENKMMECLVKQHNNKIQALNNNSRYYGCDILNWIAEFGEWNYEINKLILACLYTNDNPAEKDYDENQVIMIKKYGQKIHDRGGMTALQSNYYIMSNFMRDENVSNHIHKSHISNLQALWNGVGEWRY
jgi:hypothetical protein